MLVTWYKLRRNEKQNQIMVVVVAVVVVVVFDYDNVKRENTLYIKIPKFYL